MGTSTLSQVAVLLDRYITRGEIAGGAVAVLQGNKLVTLRTG